MLRKNLTPFLVGAKVSSRRPPAPEMTLVVRGTFRIVAGETVTVVDDLVEQGPLSAEVFAEDDEDRRGECLYGGDFADFKLRGEVMLRGSCHTPGGKPLTECPVLFRVGGWSKALRVIGPRVWSDSIVGRAFSDPSPFTTMAISWANAFGGPDHPPNPAGKGVRTRDLPTVELAGDILRSRSDRPAPAGFGPISPAWPQRAGKVGKEYGDRWRNERSPYYAEDFDWSFFNAAPADQQIEGYLHGDEELTFQNLHPGAPVLTTRLPGLRVRAFAHLRAPSPDGGERSFREVPMVLDTLFADLDEGTVKLTWRGLTAVRDDDLADVAAVLVASEEIAGDRLPEDHYRAVLEAFERDPVGIQERLPPGFEDFAARWRKQQAGEPIPEDPGAEELDPVSRLMKRRMGSFALPEQERVRATMKAIEAAAPEMAGELHAKAEEAARATPDTPPTPVSRKPGSMPSIGLRRLMRRVIEKTAELKKSIEGQPIPQAERDRIRALSDLPFDPRLQQMDPTYTPPVEPISTEPPGPGRDLAEQDLTGRDLRGMDLSGANLTGAILTRADLRGARLEGARLVNAILFRADLTGADLTAADLTRANLARVSAEGAILRRAVVDEAFFEDARLTNADLSGAKGEYPALGRADLTGARLAGASLPHADLSGAIVDRADLTGAALPFASLAECRGEGLILVDADLTRATFEAAALPRAIFTGAHADDARFQGATLDGADFGHATLRRTFFDGASAVDAGFFGADMREGRLYRATLDRARLVRANLFSADLGKASLHGTKLNDASLYGADLTGASGRGADFTGANLKRSTLERA